jgi:putative endonuclease|tara:strand:+ start:364 stop:606 length:243 start_codon:yes stop_codon:yes gene_type:complete
MYVVLCADESYYCGITTNLERRLKQHNGAIKGGAKYTRGRRPCEYIHKERASNRSDALKKENIFKKFSKSKKIKYINSFI